ncbi:class I SAM-dependent methyltransferase [Longimicrobium sp.]|jgi:SAM-dependent methyltransferase|uniref:class I SAM-dependent methyltransferase n=1 Tax=Longimicrobium sp. TaxID=2029185 RepID=UPI002ED78793
MKEPKRWVAAGYEEVAERHAEWAAGTRVGERIEYASRVLAWLAPGSTILDVGCGAAGVSTRMLAAPHRLVGLDLAWSNLELARRNVPAAAFVQADMGEVSFRPASFDAVVAFYSIFHLPRAEHGPLLSSIAGWLKPGGLLAAAFGTRDVAEGVEDDWLGVRMFSSSHPPETTVRLVRDAGLRVIDAQIRTEDEDGVPVPFLWVLAARNA